MKNHLHKSSLTTKWLGLLMVLTPVLFFIGIAFLDPIELPSLNSLPTFLLLISSSYIPFLATGVYLWVTGKNNKASWFSFATGLIISGLSIIGLTPFINIIWLPAAIPTTIILIGTANLLEKYILKNPYFFRFLLSILVISSLALILPLIFYYLIGETIACQLGYPCCIGGC